VPTGKCDTLEICDSRTTPHQPATQQPRHVPMRIKRPADHEIRIQKALCDLESGKIQFICEAARVHDVNHTTLACRRKGQVSNSAAHLDQQACTEAEEKALLNWIQQWQRQGFSIRHDHLRAMAEYMIRNRENAARRDTISEHILGYN
jgi:hypothetical protein